MKKIFFIVLGLILTCNLSFCSDLTDDYIDIAASLVQDGKYSQALSYINKAIEIENTPKLYNMRNDLYKILGRDDINLTFENQIPDDHSSNYLKMAIACYDRGNFHEAKNNLNKYIELMPKSDFAYMLRAKTNMNIDETPSALRDIKSAQTISDNYEYRIVEAIILYKSEKFAQSRDILNELSNDVQVFNVYKYLGLNNFKLGNYKEAVANFDIALLLSDEDKTIMQTYNEAKRMSYGR